MTLLDQVSISDQRRVGMTCMSTKVSQAVVVGNRSVPQNSHISLGYEVTGAVQR